ncbi:MAG: helicase-related protein [Anaerolineales bacterium]|nr:MAG: helicase-related protein [Anaerolineales bacterium]
MAQIASPLGNVFYFPDGHALDLGNPSTRFENNRRAIQIAKDVALTGRDTISEELGVLSRYVGWGDSRLANRVHELEDLLTEEEMRSVRSSSLNAHYTSLGVIASMWKAVQALGFGSRHMQVIDPSAGIGHFKSMAPAGLRDAISWTEIELDSLTSLILKVLHPSSVVINSGYEDANLPDGFFDLAMSNVPFGDYGVSSRKLPRSLTDPIHDFFFANTWSLLKPGGVMFYITSRYTMDKVATRFREWLAARFDLLSAIRLPETAFLENAGTKVITDVLLLRKRETMQDPKQAAWVYTTPQRIGSYAVNVNQYYVDHPDHIIGEPAMEGRMYHGDGYTVLTAGRDIPAEMIRIYGGLSPLEFSQPEEAAKKPLSVFADDNVLSSQQSESPIANAIMEIHGVAKRLIRAETRGDANAAVLRDVLNRLYDAFVAKHGYINKKENIRHLKNGAEAPFLKALENQDDFGYSKAGIFFQSTVRAFGSAAQVSASDALLLSLDRTGKVDLHFIAASAGITEQEAVEQLRGVIYLDPQAQEWQTSEQYLSGNVREKLRQAEAAAQYDAKFQENVAALESALPLTVQAGDIRAPLGAGWIPTDVIADFLYHLLDCGVFTVSYIEPLATWDVEAERLHHVSRQLYHQKWGTSRINTVDLVKHGLNSREVVIYDGYGEDRAVNQSETVAAQAKLLEIKDEFEKWLWQDGDRAKRLTELYNEKFNSVRTPRYDGSHLSTPGLATSIKLRSNQRDAAWRIIQNQTALVGHEVGMGKTLTAIVAAMESKRLGFTSKALIVVPNHTLVNWQAAMQVAYPGANLLIPSPDDLSKEKRPEFLSRVATNDWDLILVPFSSFKLLPVSLQSKREFFTEQIAELEEYLLEIKAQNKGKSSRSQKEVEKALKRFEKKMKDLDLFDKDSEKTLAFEELGVDLLIVDEFHAYKNLYFNTRMTRIAGLTNTDSQRAFDMFVKSRWLIKNGGKFVGLTGTPVTNTIAEMFTMQRYFQMDTLRSMGLHQFDAWARQFALAEPGLEMTPDGSGFRMNTRFRKFVNMTELMQLWLQAADMRRVDPAEIQRPDLHGGKPVKAVSFAGQELIDFVKTLAERAEKVRSGRVRPEEDNMLMITSDGRKAAADLSLVIPASPDAEMPKVDGLTSLAALICEATDPVKGTQLIFCDLGVPKAKAVRKDDDESSDAPVETEQEARLTENLYGVIRDRLVRCGVPAEEIAFIHDAKNEKARAELFNAVNAGRIRILIGSNEKMGTGLNVQERLVAVHHMTPPWRPGDLEQQLGRMLRQGNLFPTVYQFVHVLSGSFDGYTWQLLENKASFIAQIMSGSLTDREVDDIGDTVLTFSEIKALASGNPKIMRKITLEAEWQRMKALYDSWHGSQFSLKNDLRFKQGGIDGERKLAEAFREAIRMRDESAAEEFRIELHDVWDHSKTDVLARREDAGKRLKALAAQAVAKCLRGGGDVPLGTYRGQTLFCSIDNRIDPKDPQPYTYIDVNGKTIPFAGNDDVGITRSLDHALKRMDKHLTETEATIQAWERDISTYEEALAQPWEHQEKFNRLCEELSELEKELSADGGGESQPAAAARLRQANPEDEKREIIEAVQSLMNDPAPKAISERLRGIASREVIKAVLSMQEMMREPSVLSRFDDVEADAVTQVMPADAESLEALAREIKRLQAQYEFGATIQLSLFGDAAAAPQPQRKRRK